MGFCLFRDILMIMSIFYVQSYEIYYGNTCICLACLYLFLPLSFCLCLSLRHPRHLNFLHWISWQVLYEITWWAGSVHLVCNFHGWQAAAHPNLSEIQMTCVLGTELKHIHVSTHNCVPPFFCLWTQRLLIWGLFGLGQKNCFKLTHICPTQRLTENVVLSTRCHVLHKYSPTIGNLCRSQGLSDAKIRNCGVAASVPHHSWFAPVARATLKPLNWQTAWRFHFETSTSRGHFISVWGHWQGLCSE